MNKLEYKDLIAFHPGYYISELLKYTGMSQKELAKQLHVYSDRVNPSARTNCTTFTKKQNRFHGRCASPISFILQIFLFQSVN